MGVDVRLLPLIEKDFWVAHNILQLERRRDLWSEIEALPSHAISKRFTCFLGTVPDGSFKGEKCYGECTDDPYGNHLRYVTAADLMTLANHPAVKDNWQNRATWAYLSEMPADWPIVIYWH